MFERLKALYKPKAQERLKITAPSASNLAPVVVIACGAGMAFWWWSQWARSREEARLADADSDAEPIGDVTEIVDSEAANGLDESLAVQAEARTPPGPMA